MSHAYCNIKKRHIFLTKNAIWIVKIASESFYWLSSSIAKSYNWIQISFNSKHVSLDNEWIFKKSFLTSLSSSSCHFLTVWSRELGLVANWSSFDVQEASYYKLLCHILRPLGDFEEITKQIVMKFWVNDCFALYRKTIRIFFKIFEY